MKDILQRTVELENTRLWKEDRTAKHLGMSVAWLRKRRLDREPPFPVRLGAAVRYRPEDIEAYIESLATSGDR